MRSSRNAIILSAALTAASVLTGCPAAPVANGPANTGTNTPAPSPAQTVAAAPTPSPEPGTVGSIATPTDAYKTAHAYRQQKDIQSLKRVLSNEILEFFGQMGRARGKSLDDGLRELVEKPQFPTAESRNEKITGGRAVLEFKDENGKWQEMDFVNENGGWKLTLPEKKDAGKGGSNRKKQ